MKLHQLFCVLSVVLMLACTGNVTRISIDHQHSNTKDSKNSRPNILLIVADDLAYSDLGAYGSEIETTHIDSLAKQGLQFTQFYASPNCSPTRAMLFAGMDHHQAGIGAMAGFQNAAQKGQPGYEGHLSLRAASLAAILQDAGYATYMAGKWHLGGSPELMPRARGFDSAWIQKGATPQSHFSLVQRRQYYYDNGKPVTKAPENYFSSNFYTDTLINYLKSQEHSEQPFFAYLAFSAPHFPLMAPQQYLDAYKGRYDKGWDTLRRKRFQRMQKLGLIDKNIPLPKLASISPLAKNWRDLSPNEQKRYARGMEIYAAMVDNLDDNVGKIIRYLKNTGKYKNTLVIFMSDNGPSGRETPPVIRGVSSVANLTNLDHSLENMGRENSFVFYGAGWASVSATPFSLHKFTTGEGGLRVPFILSGGVIKSRGLRSHILSARDIAPTLLDFARAEYPQNIFRGRTVISQTGRSFAKLTDNPLQEIYPPDYPFGFELWDRRALRMGNWKITWLEAPYGPDSWQLYDLANDPGETTDLAAQYPDKLKKLILGWQYYVANYNVIVGDKVQF